MEKSRQSVDSSKVKSYQFDRVISVRPKSVVLEYTQENQIFKSYSPKHFRQHISDYDERILGPSGWLREQSYTEFRKELAIIKAAANLEGEESFAPDLIYEVPELKCFVMRRLPYQTWDSYFASKAIADKANGEKQKAVGEFIDILIAFHGIMGRNFSELYLQLKRKGNHSALEPRTVDNEYYRWLNYIEMLIYKTSPGFVKYLEDDGQKVLLDSTKIEKTQRKRIRSLVRAFAKVQGLNLEDAVHQIVTNDREIIYGNSKDLTNPNADLKNQLRSLAGRYKAGLVTIVHGDYKPNNVFKVPAGSQVKVCDFPGMRIDARAYDLVSAIYTNAYLAPRNPAEEVTSLELVRRYVDGVKAEEGIEIDPKFLIIATQEMRLKRLVHLFSGDSIFFNKELSDYCDLPQFKGINSKECFKKSFLDRMFNKGIRGLTDEILSGELGGFIHDFEGSTLLRQQAESIEEVLVKTDVLKPSSKSRRREDLERIIAPVAEGVIPNPENTPVQQ